ncbi:transmembrane protein 213 [Rhinatrema bivittatum]|uniref:transmembrane protein 213 n=1 Tax=Rhinatrema bivittatum TaxID=194408 RepID=UPI001127BEA1|nr:transmembrane protein 213 [Rhinatrema bivittatum]
MKRCPLPALSPALLLPLATLCLALSEGAGAGTGNGTSSSQIQCPNKDFCSQVSRCCQIGVDEYGWIAAAVGWSLWFLTLILLCVGKLINLGPDEPKYNQV